MARLMTDALHDHFTRAWDMLLDAAARFDDAGWCVAEASRMQPARIVYHILMGHERYTWLGEADDFLAVRRYSLNWENTPAADLPSRDEALALITQAKTESFDWLQHHGEAGLLASPPWPWVGGTNLAQAIYSLRHLQHHLAELNAELLRRGLEIAEWK